jgi:rod shape-determining protein MreC
MPLGTLDRTPPPFFKQGPSAFSKLMVLSALAIFLMIADARLSLVQPVRAVLATVLYPLQHIVMQPVHTWRWLSGFLTTVTALQQEQQRLEVKLTEQATRAMQVDQLLLENQRLRALLHLGDRVGPQGIAAQVLYDAADPYIRKVVIDRGLKHGIVQGSPVLDESGILGQVTRAHPFVSEVTLLTDRDQAIPVLNTRTGVRSVAHGQSGSTGNELELRFMAGNADVRVGDLLSTSGIDGVYPPGLPVAKVTQIERRAESAFARVVCEPLAQMLSTQHVWVLPPVGEDLPPSPLVQEPPTKSKNTRLGTRQQR